jgi:hypothetical protein
MATDMTTAMTEAYFRNPPKTDWIVHARRPEGLMVLACHIDDSPWEWNAGFGLLIHKHTGVAKPRTGFAAKRPVEAYFDPRTINAEVRVDEYARDWRDSDLSLMASTVIDTKPVPPEPPRSPRVLHAQAPLKRAEQKKRAKGFHPSMRNVTPSDHMTDEDRKHFMAQARELMANFCHLTHALPQCKILASKLTLRLLEAIEWEMINTAEWGRGLTTKIDDALRSAGAPHGPQRADGSDDLSIERWEQQREGARFQYHWMQLVFRAWSDQMVDTFTEYGGFMQGTQNNSNARQGIEHTGHTWEYVPVLLRQKQKKERARNVEKLSAVHRAMLIGKPPEEFEAYYERYTGFKPRKGKSVHDKATPHVAQPMSEGEATWMDEEGHHAGYTLDDDGNVVD